MEEKSSSQSQPVFAPKSATREAERSAAWAPGELITIRPSRLVVFGANGFDLQIAPPTVTEGTEVVTPPGMTP